MNILKNALLGALFAASALTVVPTVAGAVIVGSNDSGNCYPFNCNDSGTNVGESIHYQQIYSASAFSGATSFNAVSFFAWAPNPGPVLNGNYKISFATTTAGLGSGYPVAPLSNVSVFFNGALGGPVGSLFTVSGSGYSYNPADGNLVMDIVVTNQDLVPNGSGNGYFEADYTGASTTRAYLLGDGVQEAGVGALVTQFGGAVPEPATWALMLMGFGGMGLMLRGRRALAAA